MSNQRPCLPILLIVSCLPRLAGAEEPKPSEIVETVVVSTTVATEGRDAVPFTDLSGDEIAPELRGQDLGMLLAETPNAYAYSDSGNGVGYSYLSLRGFDQRRIAVLINGIPLNGPENRQVYYIDLADFAGSLDRIQVQRGAGTAQYGSPAVGGLVNLETGHLPMTEGGEVALGAASFGTLRTSLRYGGPLPGGRWAWMARLAHVQSDGYRQPSWTRHTLGHLAFERFGNDSTLRIHLFGGPEETQLAYYGVPIENLHGEITGDADRDRRANPLRRGETDTFVQPHLQVLYDRRVAPGVFLRSAVYAIYGYGYFRQLDTTFSYDPLGASPPTSEFPELTLAEAWRKRSIENRQVGWIPSVSWEHAGGTLTAGLELLFHTGHHRGQVTEAVDCLSVDASGACIETGAAIEGPLTLYDYQNRKSTASAFVRETLRPVPSLALNLELQGTWHDYAMRHDDVRGYSFDTTYTFLTPRVGVVYTPAERWNLYAGVSTARSEPTFSNVWDPQDPFSNPGSSFARHDASGYRYSEAFARPERLVSVEAGAGFRAAGGASFKANLYLMDFRDELVYAGGLDDDGLPITDNAARSTHRGIELEGTVRLPGEVDLHGHGSVSHDVLKEYVVYGWAPGEVFDYSGNRIAAFPDHLVRLGLARQFGPVRCVLNGSRVGTIYLDQSENERKNPSAREVPGYVDKKIDPVNLVEARATVDLARVLRGRGTALTLDVAVENLFDKRYVASGYVYGVPYFYPAATRSFFAGVTYGF